MWENRKTMAMAVKDMEELDPKTALPAGVAVHPGAAKFWKEAK